MHAIWLAIIVPLLAGAVWVVPALRVTRVWFAFFVLALLATTIWLGFDLYQFADSRDSINGAGLRTIYLFLSRTQIPALQLTLGMLTAGVLSWRLNLAARTAPGDPTIDPKQDGAGAHP